VVSVWTPLTHPEVAARWFSFPNLLLFAPVPLLVAICIWWLLRSLKRNPYLSPFIAALGLIFLGYTGLAISIWPHIVPPNITIWSAASPPQSQGFTLLGTLFILPFILGYTAWSYYVFRGKVKAGEGYH
jgi:cytochrome d ubiquinol oxidase subunit II